MKKKLLMALCACMLLGGCTNAADLRVSNDPSVSEVTSTGDENKGGDIKGEDNKGEDGGKTKGDEETTLEGTVSNKTLGASGENELTPVTLIDDYEKAAYFADQVYLANHGNTLVSPLSLEVALGLTYEGASGQTKDELQSYLGKADYGDWVDQYMTFAEGAKVSGGQNDGYSFAYELANSIWVKKESKLKSDYQALVEKKYRATAQNVDFINEPEETADKINAWCDAKTHGMIKKMVSPDMFTESLEAILMNSVYFESPWMEEWQLTQHEFTSLDGVKETREMMRDMLDVYFENEYATGFAKGYYNGFQFIGILPKQEGDFNLSDLDVRGLLASRTTKYFVNAIAPKLNYETTAENIVDILKAQGVLQAFDRFNGMFDELVEEKELYISDILQKCKIEMDDKGTRAAAVTAVFEAECDACEEPVVKEQKEVFLDRPFAFLIYDSVNDKIVFAGKVVE